MQIELSHPICVVKPQFLYLRIEEFGIIRYFIAHKNVKKKKKIAKPDIFGKPLIISLIINCSNATSRTQT